jgi:hypothetical protein
MGNRELLEQAGAALDQLGVKALSPTVPTTATMASGEFMDRKAVEHLVDLGVSQSAWLSAVSLKLRSQRKGEVPRIQINEVVTEGVEENGNSTISTHPDTSNVSFECKKYQSTWYITHESVREAAASGEPDYDNKVRGAFAKAIGNDMARAGLLGDTALPATTRLNRLLRQRDGWLKQIRTGGNVFQTTRGSAFAWSLFPALLGNMPEEFADDADLRFLISSKIDLGLTNLLATANSGPAAGSELSDRAATQRKRFEAMGIPPLILPQMPTTLGFDTLAGSAVDADSVADDADGTLTALVDTLLGAYAAGNAGRRVKITHDTTGESETLTVTDESSHNYIHSVGSLGQSSISTTASDYTVDVADCTSALLSNPVNLGLVLCDKMRAYRKFEQEAERWRIDVYWEADFIVHNLEATVLQDGIVTPRFSYGS